ncbi:MAG: SGNH/GDSL hydrolase family protein [Polyangiaceae bacterium]
MTKGPLPPARTVAKRLGAVVLGVIAAELLLRVALFACAHLLFPPSPTSRSETLGRLWYAYSGGLYSALTLDSDVATTYDPHRGYRQAPGLRDHAMFGATLSTNSRGIRGAQEYAVPKPAPVTRIVALGDSMTFGEGVPDDATWPAQLAARMPGVEVANLGGRGYAHDQMYFALVDDGVSLQPDVVVLAFFEPDLMRDELTFYSYEKPRVARTSAGWGVENLPVPEPRDLIHRVMTWPLVYAVPRGLLELTRPLDPETDYDPARAREIFRMIRAATEKAGARFVMVDLPGRPEEAPERPGFFHDYCARADVECVETWPLFHLAADDPRKLPGPYRLPGNIHYSREGYAVVAEALRAHLATHPVKPVPGQPTPTQTSTR